MEKVVYSLGTNAQVVVDIDRSEGPHRVVLSFDTAPTAGTVTLEYQARVSGPWISAGSSRAAIYSSIFIVNDDIEAFRVTYAGRVGGSGFVMKHAASVVEPLPSGVFEGFRAMTVQPYTEANVKNGTQFYARASWPLTDAIATGTSRKLWVKTGDKKVTVKLRDFQFIAEELLIELFAFPTGVTGGSTLAVHNYNLVNPQPTSIIDARKNVTTVTDGIAFDSADPEYLFGASSSPQRVLASIPVGRERIIPANSEFLVVISNTGSGNARAQYFLDWYEGELDLPLPD